MAHRPIDLQVGIGADHLTLSKKFDVTQVDAQVSSTDTPLFPFGTRVRCFDTVLFSVSEFIYAKGVASVVAGDFMIIKHGDNAGILLDDTAVLSEGGGLGVAMAAVVANTYGWFQIWGRATCNVLSGFAADGIIFASTTAGTVDDSAGGGQVLGAKSESAIDTPSSGQAYIDIWYPNVNGQATGLDS